MTIRSPAKLGALSHRSLSRPQSPQIGPECGSNPGRACQTRAQDDVVHVAAPACGCSANPLNISSREDRCCFLRCYRNPDMGSSRGTGFSGAGAGDRPGPPWIFASRGQKGRRNSPPVSLLGLPLGGRAVPCKIALKEKVQLPFRTSRFEYLRFWGRPNSPGCGFSRALTSFGSTRAAHK